MIYVTSHFSIYFGNASDKLYPQEYLAYTDATPLTTREPYARVCKTLGVQELTFCRQVHGVVGYIAALAPSVFPQPFVCTGDYLITNQPIALGVMTADCLPLALYDQETGACGMVHAGWRGTANGVIQQTIEHMEREFGSKAADLQVVFGPAAGVCCYAVTAEFKEHFLNYSWHHELFVERDGALFFDLPACAGRILQDCGVDRRNIMLDYHACTICCVQYCSHRRDKEQAGRQMTIIAPHR